MSTSDFVWSPNRLSLSEFLEHHQHSLPIVIQVTEGWLAESEEESFGNGEVIRVSSCESQTRVVGIDSRGRHISIPVDYPEKMRIQRNKNNEIKSLREIADHENLPLKVSFEREENLNFFIGNHSEARKSKFGIITIFKVYEERFLKANFVTTNDFLPTVLVIPLYLMIRVSIATGLTKGQAQTWKDLHQAYDKAAAGIDYKDGGGGDILLYDPKLVDNATKDHKFDDSHLYDVVTPSEYLHLERRTRASDNTYTEINTQNKQLDRNPSTVGTISLVETPSRPPIPENMIDNGPPLPPRNRVIGRPRNRSNRESVTSDRISIRVDGLHGDESSSDRVPGLKPPKPPKPEPVQHAPAARSVSLTGAELEKRKQQLKQTNTTDTEYGRQRSHSVDEEGKQLSEVPDDISSFTVDEVADCLCMLKLSEYQDQFRFNQIDGALLSSLDAETLEDEFKMNKFQSKKVVMFAQQGWRPKFSKNTTHV